MRLAYPEAPLTYTPEQKKAHTARVIASIADALNASDETELKRRSLGLENVIHHNAWMAGVHPGIVLVALQREQSLLAVDGKQSSEMALRHATGFVGQHVPGTANTGWDSLPLQAQLCVRATAWHANTARPDFFGYRPGLWPTSERWRGTPIMVDLLNLDGTFNRKKRCETVEEYVSWRYTPNALKDVHAENLSLWQQYVEPRFSWSNL